MAFTFTRDPESGELYRSASSVGTWVFAISGLVFLYGIITFGAFLLALHHLRTKPLNHRAYKVAICLTLPLFPIGTIYSCYAHAKLEAEKAVH